MGRRNKTARRRPIRGGLRPDIKDIMDSVPMTPNLTVNPNSKFVVATYWWGRGNMNKNTQRPCVGDLQEQFKEDLVQDLEDSDEDFQDLMAQRDSLRQQLRQNPESEDIKKKLHETNKRLIKYQEDFFNSDRIKSLVNTKPAEMFKKEREAGKGRDPILFEQMMKIWEDRCKQMNCNYMAVEYPFQPKVVVNGVEVNQYQYAINAKPYFIKKALEVCQGRGVLYIDGDMFVNKYPELFDIDGVDFMARGWNMDPRSSAEFLEGLCFDPYSFETSGGTMFFANTPKSHAILDRWIEEASKAIHDKKADDRVLSMFFTQENWTQRASVLPLPIEYLWLTDMYEQQRSIMHGYADACDAIIEHPACLTSEDTATAGTTTTRTPEGYDKIIYDNQKCETYGGVFYEYIFFPTERMVSSFGPYLQYLRKAFNQKTREPLYKVVSFADQYGEFNSIADANLDKASAVQVNTTTPVAKLPMGTDIPTILAHLEAGVDVQMGDDSRPLTEGTDCRIKLPAGYLDGKAYMREVQIDTSGPIYFSHRNPVLLHLVTMCQTIEDINKHLQSSYIFASRIRWTF
jgi:hypothetical protein